MELLRYPIGRYQSPNHITGEMVQTNIVSIAQFPSQLQRSLRNATPEMLQTTYRPNGWNLAQVVHHCADSHINAYIRTKWALTEEQPLIKAYDEASWALLSDSQAEMPIEISVQLITALHQRWVYLLNSLTKSDFQKSFIHPETGKTITIQELTCIYAWHCRHHLAHVRLITESEEENS